LGGFFIFREPPLQRLLALCLVLLFMTAAGVAHADDISAATWSETDSSNTSTPPAGWPTNMAANQVEPTARAMMGAIKRWYDHANAIVTSGGSANAQTLTYSVAPSAYVSGDGYVFIAGYSNSGAVTLNVNALGAKSIKIGTADLASGQIAAGAVAVVYYDGTNFQLVNSTPAGAAGGYLSGTYPNPTVAKTKGTTTNDNAAAGDVGEYTESVVGSGSAVTLTFSGQGYNITSLSLAAGDWDVDGAVHFNPGASGATVAAVSLSQVSATFPSGAFSGTIGATSGPQQQVALPSATTTSQTIATGTGRLSVASTTTVYLVAQAVSPGTPTAWGYMRARRVR
jgi:hypothetical protein